MTALRLPIGHYTVCFRLRQELRFTQHAGSAWRSAFGHALKRTVCVTREPICSACLLFRSCPYPYLFETRPQTVPRRCAATMRCPIHHHPVTGQAGWRQRDARSLPLRGPVRKPLAAHLAPHLPCHLSKLGSYRHRDERPHDQAQEVVRNALQVVRPLEYSNILRQILLMHSSKSSQEIPQACPSTFHCIAVYLPLAIAVIISCVFSG